MRLFGTFTKTLVSGSLVRETKVARESTKDIKHPLQAAKSSLVLLQSRTGSTSVNLESDECCV